MADAFVFCDLDDLVKKPQSNNFFDECALHEIVFNDAEVCQQVALLASARRRSKNRLSAHKSREAAKRKRARLEAEVQHLGQTVLELQAANDRIRLCLANHGATPHV